VPTRYHAPCRWTSRSDRVRPDLERPGDSFRPLSARPALPRPRRRGPPARSPPTHARDLRTANHSTPRTWAGRLPGNDHGPQLPPARRSCRGTLADIRLPDGHCVREAPVPADAARKCCCGQESTGLQPADQAIVRGPQPALCSHSPPRRALTHEQAPFWCNAIHTPERRRCDRNIHQQPHKGIAALVRSSPGRSVDVISLRV